MMATTTMSKNTAVIGFGSNIEPQQNVFKAKVEMSNVCRIIKESKFVITKPLLFKDQPDFLNGAVLVETDLDFSALKEELKDIEARCGRVKDKNNKSAPRTIDLDILIFNDKVTDNDVYERDFLRTSISELMPDFISLKRRALL